MGYEKSLILITGGAEDSTDFGTGFVIDQDGGYSYILTCAHVVRNAMDKEGKVKVNNFIADVVAIGTPNGADDLAVLRVEGLFGAPLSRLDIGYEGLSFTSIGYQRTYSGKTSSVITLLLQGELGESNFQQIPGQGSLIKLWALN